MLRPQAQRHFVGDNGHKVIVTLWNCNGHNQRGLLMRPLIDGWWEVNRALVLLVYLERMRPDRTF